MHAVSLNDDSAAAPPHTAVNKKVPSAPVRLFYKVDGSGHVTLKVLAGHVVHADAHVLVPVLERVDLTVRHVEDVCYAKPLKQRLVTSVPYIPQP